MPGPGAEAANCSAATSAAFFPRVTIPEEGAGAKTSSSDDDENPFYPEVVDVESVSTDLSEHRKTFADRLRHLLRRLRKTGEDDGEDFTYDFEVDQIVKSCTSPCLRAVRWNPDTYLHSGPLHRRLP